MLRLNHSHRTALALAALILLPAAAPTAAHADTAPASPESPTLPGNPGNEPALPGSPQAPDNPAKGQADPGNAGGALDIRPLQKEKGQAKPRQEPPPKGGQAPGTAP